MPSSDHRPSGPSGATRRAAADRLHVTPAEVFFDRRRFLWAAAAAGLTVGPLAGAGCLADQSGDSGGAGSAGAAGESVDPRIVPPNRWPEGVSPIRDESIVLPSAIERRAMTPRLVAGSHNNFYEFLPGRGGDVWPLTGDFDVSTWRLEVTGACDAPRTWTLEELYRLPITERVCHFRCVERWAMNVPWSGVPLKTIIERAKPTAKASHVRFVTADRPAQMPGIREARHFTWPYFEGLRMDEAAHELTLLALGIYGEPLTKQHGAPVRLVVPWKYGYKGAKSIVRIEFVESEPETFWRKQQPHEYGFLSNVNPNIPHPRWAQDESYWLDTRTRFPTPIFNGYEAEVADLYPDEPREPQDALEPGQVAR